MSQPPRPPVVLGDTLAKLTDMLDAVGGTVDRDRRRAAARVSELVRSTDDDLDRFVARHLPGRDVDVDALKDARELFVELAGLVALIGADPTAAATLREMRASLSGGATAHESDDDGDTSSEQPSAPPVLAAPPIMAAQPAAAALPTFMQAPLSASPAPWPTAAEPASRITPPPSTQPAPTFPPAPRHEVPVRTGAPDLGGTQKLRALPPGTPAAPVLPFAPTAPAHQADGHATRSEAPTTALPFVPPPPRRG